MKIEFEATFIDLDIDTIREKLKVLGAKLLKPETLMKRIVFTPPQTMPGAWLRVRDEGDKITLSLKQVTGEKIEDQTELCLTIDNFDQGVSLLESLGCVRKSYQETKREEWHLDGVEITIDTWPGLEPFVEIEGKNESAVRQTTEKLDLNYNEALFGSVDIIYEKKLGIPPDVINNRTFEITFANPPQKVKSSK
jgi:adenylate cyclase class 2